MKLDYGVEMYAMRKLLVVLLLVMGVAHAGDFELCINGVNLQGRPCSGFGSTLGGMRHQQIVAVGDEAMEIFCIQNVWRVVLMALGAHILWDRIVEIG